jgi:outer membrane protein TolC
MIGRPHSNRWILWPCAVISAGLFLGNSWAADGTLTLEESIRLAAERNERAKVSAERVEAAAASVDRARAFFFPDLTATGSYGRRNDAGTVNISGQTITSDDRTVRQAAVSLTLPLFDARSFPLYRQAVLNHAAARFSRDEAVRLLTFEAADAYLQTLGVEQVRDSADQRLAFAQRTLEDTRARFEAKLVSRNDLTRAELELATAQRQATQARAEVALFRLQLGYLIGAEVGGELVAPAELPDPSPPDEPELLVSEARGRRLDLAAGAARIEALEAFALEPARRIIPILGFNSQFRQNIETGPDEKDWFVGLNLTWSLYDGGERRAERAERLAESRIAALELTAAQRQVETDVRRALVSIDSARAVNQQALAAAEVGRRNLEEVTVLYRQGLATALEVADANLRLFEAEVALARARYDVRLSWLDLWAALGLDPLGKEVPS